MNGSGARKRAASGSRRPPGAASAGRGSRTRRPSTVWPAPCRSRRREVSASCEPQAQQLRPRRDRRCAAPCAGTTAAASSMSACDRGRARARPRARSRVSLHHHQAQRALLAHHLADVGDPRGGGDPGEAACAPGRRARAGRPRAPPRAPRRRSPWARCAAWRGRTAISSWRAPGDEARSRPAAATGSARGRAARPARAISVRRAGGRRDGRASRRRPSSAPLTSTAPVPGSRREGEGAERRTRGPRGPRCAGGRRCVAPSSVICSWPSSCSSKPSSSGHGLRRP